MEDLLFVVGSLMICLRQSSLVILWTVVFPVENRKGNLQLLRVYGCLLVDNT